MLEKTIGKYKRLTWGPVPWHIIPPYMVQLISRPSIFSFCNLSF